MHKNFVSLLSQRLSVQKVLNFLYRQRRQLLNPLQYLIFKRIRKENERKVLSVGENTYSSTEAKE